MSADSPSEKEEVKLSARRTESIDTPEIEKLVSSSTNDVFGRVNVAFIIEKANLAVTITDDQNTVVGHAAFYDYPNLPTTVHWQCWFSENFELQDCDPVNTLFLHYFVSQEDFSEKIFKEIVRTVFHAIPLLHFLILMVPLGVNVDNSLTCVFQSVNQSSSFNTDYQAFVAHRHQFCPVLHIRPAEIEDHDDLMPIFDCHSNHLTEIYGDFFLAELMEAQDENNKCIVATVDGTAVGFMSISTSVNMSILKENFHLDVYDYFVKKIEHVREIQKVNSNSKEEVPILTSEEVDEADNGRMSQASNKLESEDGFLSPTSTGSVKRLRTPPRNKLPQSPTKSRAKSSSAHLRHRAKEEGTVEIEYIKEILNVDSVFCIQLFCIDEKYEARSIDFLPAIFKCFPDKEYVVITVPHTVPEFPLLQTFQRVSPKPTSILPQELYVFNRNGLLRSFSVRACKEEDLEQIISLTETIQGNQDIVRDIKRYNDYRRDEDGVRIHAYVGVVHQQIVGICVFRQEQDVEYIRSHYNIEDFVYFRLYEDHEQAHLHHFVMNPVFQHYAKYFIKQVMHLSKASCFYYPIYADPSQIKGLKPHSLVTCLSCLVPVSARRQISYPLEELESNAPIDSVLKKVPPYALYHINRKLTLEPKVVINIHVVVVGGSDVGLSMLQSLVFCPHLYFNNLTLVTDTDVFNTNQTHEELRNSFLPFNTSFDATQQALLSLPTWVNVVFGKMTKINRKNNYILINGKQKVPYNQLILCTGEQFHTTVPTGANIKDLLTTNEALQLNAPLVHLGFLPKNVFVLNCLNDCLNIKEWLQNSMKTDKMIVYGDTIESYCCINGLLAYGVDGSCISHVHPVISVPSCFNDPHVDGVMKKELEKAGVKSYHGYTLAQWNDGKEEEKLSLASFTSNAKPLALECQAFFCCDKKTIDYNAFKAINDSCLVYDGRLVIDSRFHTNDESIQAAGTLTKFSRRYHSENWTHANFNSIEIGKNLAESFLELFDPTLDGVIQEYNKDLIPKYKEPKSIYCRLPGNYYYYHIWKTCVKTALETQKLQPDYGQDLITGGIDRADEPEYFRLHLNTYNTVQDITCLTRKSIDVGDISCLYGMHERYLNNMAQRYKEGLIKDFYSFFKESWCLAIYHDRFKEFRNEIRDIFFTPKGESASLEERVRRMVREGETHRPEHMGRLVDFFVGTEYKKKIEERLFCFLEYNRYHLPMFARPGML